MARKIIFSGLLVLLVITIAALELTGTNQTLSTAAKEAKNRLQALRESKAAAEASRPAAPSKIAAGEIPAGSHCKWEFSHYESSAYEEEWFSIVEEAQAHICKTVATPKHAAASESIVKRVIGLNSIDPRVKWRTYDSLLPEEPGAEDHYFSRMHYSKSCLDLSTNTYRPVEGQGIQLIEPLWGMLRDPYDIFCRDQRLKMPEWSSVTEGQSKQHVLPQGFAPYWYTDGMDGAIPAWRSHGIPPWHSTLVGEQDPKLGLVFSKPQNIHLDLGSSYFAGWSMERGENHENAAASGKWFYEKYHERGQPFDRFIAVELEVLNDTLAYEQVPDDLVGKYTLMNVGLTMDAGDKLNTIDMIKRIVRPEDFFVFKLDIDSAPIEMPIIRDLLADDPKKGGASGLIDELMFEHHVNYAPMSPGPWSDGPFPPEGTLASSYDVFRTLRRKGIRAHSWP